MQSADFKRTNDFVQWWVEKVDGRKRHDSYALTAALIQLNIAGIQSTGMVVSAGTILAERTPRWTTDIAKR